LSGLATARLGQAWLGNEACFAVDPFRVSTKGATLEVEIPPSVLNEKSTLYVENNEGILARMACDPTAFAC